MKHTFAVTGYQNSLYAEVVLPLIAPYETRFNQGINRRHWSSKLMIALAYRESAIEPL